MVTKQQARPINNELPGALRRAEIQRQCDDAIWQGFCDAAQLVGVTVARPEHDPETKAAVVEKLRDVVLSNTEL